MLLWLQLAMVALLALALMRPVTAGGLKGESVFVFDLSASMQAVNEQGVSRMEEAKRQALDLLSGMRDGDAVTVLAAGTSFSPVVSRSTDHALAEHAIRSLEAGNGGADLSGALSLAAAMKRETSGMEIYVFTDCTVEIPQDAHLRAVGEGASNVSLMDMSLQPEENTAFVRLVSWGGDAQVEVECYADGALCDVRARFVDRWGEPGRASDRAGGHAQRHGARIARRCTGRGRYALGCRAEPAAVYGPAGDGGQRVSGGGAAPSSGAEPGAGEPAGCAGRHQDAICISMTAFCLKPCPKQGLFGP